MQRVVVVFIYVAAVAVTTAAIASSVPHTATSTAATLTTVKVPRDVLADGRPLAAGTYEIRLTDDWVQPLEPGGQQGTRWVEFFVNGTVVGREAALVIPASAIGEISSWHPSEGETRVDLLQSGDFVRVWVNSGGTNYLIHLPVRK